MLIGSFYRRIRGRLAYRIWNASNPIIEYDYHSRDFPMVRVSGFLECFFETRILRYRPTATSITL